MRSGDPTLIPSMLRRARPARAANLVSFADLGESIFHDMEREGSGEGLGSVCRSLPSLNSLCKGFRRGELVVLTGPTGTRLV